MNEEEQLVLAFKAYMDTIRIEQSVRVASFIMTEVQIFRLLSPSLFNICLSLLIGYYYLNVYL